MGRKKQGQTTVLDTVVQHIPRGLRDTENPAEAHSSVKFRSKHRINSRNLKLASSGT